MKKPLIITFIVLFGFSLPKGIAQSFQDIIATLEIDTLLNHGPKDNRINLAFANIDHESARKYTQKEDLLADVNEILTRFDPNDPNTRIGYSQYRNFFNVYNIWFPEPFLFETKPEYYQKAQGLRDALFLPWADDQHGWITMVYTLKDGGGGGAGLDRNRRVGDANIWGLDWETILHEFNHTMPGVLDEYTASGAWSNYTCLEGPNTTGALSLDDVPWRKWIEPGTPIPTPYEDKYFDKIGVFEGTISGYFGCHRPTARGCYMGAGGFGEGYGQNMCSICLQRFICMNYQYVDVIENPSPAAKDIEINGPQTITFSADFVTPIPNTQRYEWRLNGRLIAKNVTSVEVSFDDCDQYSLELTVLDSTEYVRYDAKFADRYPEPRQTRTWTINQTTVDNYDLDFSRAVEANDCGSLATGQIMITANGGQAPYTYLYNGEEGASAMNSLMPGDYEVTVLDAKGCGQSQTLVVPEATLLDARLISKLKENGNWDLSVATSNYSINDLSFQWSDGQTTPSIEVNQPGAYQVNISTPGGCTLQKIIDLEEVSTPFSNSYQVVMTPINEADGAIYLTNTGGLTPYDIKWYEGAPQDFSSPNEQRVLSSGNGEIQRHLPAYAFDDIIQYDVDFWAEGFTGSNYIGYNFGTPTPILFYSITSNVDVWQRDAKDWKLQGSNDGTNWEIIDQKTDFTFSFRLTKEQFFLDHPANYSQYRLLITANHGDDWVAIQEVEFGGIEYQAMPEHDGKSSIVKLAAGYYQYEVNDQNNSSDQADIQVKAIETTAEDALTVTQVSARKVAPEELTEGLLYYWFADAEASEWVHVGPDFGPPASGNYFVRAYDPGTGIFTSAAKGFAVSVATAPQVEVDSLGLHVVAPDSEATYFWYNAEDGDQPIFEGTDFIPAASGTFYVSKRNETNDVSPIDPLSISGITLWMDASDLDGNGETDAPLASSSAYHWNFRKGGQWEQNSWFPYRGSYQNGLGVVDFATMWFQYLDGGTNQIQSIMLAYEENDLSFPGSAPIYGLLENIPKYQDASRLFSESAPARTLNGEVRLNGEVVDPLTTPNPLDFMLLSVVMTEKSDAYTFASHEYWEGKIGEIIIWDRPLTTEQTEGIHAFLRKKWISLADLESPRSAGTWSDVSTGVFELEASRQLLISPNPTTGQIRIQATGVNQWDLHISDLQGRLLWQQKGEGANIQLDLSHLENGFYFVLVRDRQSGTMLRQRVIKTR